MSKKEEKRSPGFEKKREEETRDDTAELAIKKGRQVFQEKNRGVTPPVAAWGVTHPSDATAFTTLSLPVEGSGVVCAGFGRTEAHILDVFFQIWLRSQHVAKFGWVRSVTIESGFQKKEMKEHR